MKALDKMTERDLRRLRDRRDVLQMRIERHAARLFARREEMLRLNDLIHALKERLAQQRNEKP